MTALTPARLREMIEAAGKATPGPYVVLPTGGGFACITTINSPLASLGTPERCAEVRRDDAAHIAACSPEVIIALCRIALAAQRVDDEDCRGNVVRLMASTGDAINQLRDALREAGL